MNKKEIEMILLVVFFSLVIAFFFNLSLTKDTKIQDLEHELATNKVQAKQKCNDRFLGVLTK